MKYKAKLQVIKNETEKFFIVQVIPQRNNFIRRLTTKNAAKRGVDIIYCAQDKKRAKHIVKTINAEGKYYGPQKKY